MSANASTGTSDGAASSPYGDASRTSGRGSGGDAIDSSVLWILFCMLVAASLTSTIIAYMWHRRYTKALHERQVMQEAKLKALLAPPTPPDGTLACQSPGSLFQLAIRDASMRAGENFYGRDVEVGAAPN